MTTFFDYLMSVHRISKEAKAALEAICTEQQYEKNEQVQPIGHSCRTIYFVKKGALRIFYFKGEIEVTESFEFENSIVARVESLFTERPSRKAIQALENSEIISISAPKLFKLYDSFPELERLFRKVFEQLHVSTVNRIESIQFYDAEERYINLLKERPDVLQRVPLKYIATYLGITQVSLSRIRAKK